MQRTAMPATLLSLALLLPSAASQCLFSSPANSQTAYSFDASALASASGDYQWQDTRAMNTASSGSNYTYTFNVCHPVNAANVPSGTCPQDPNLAAFQWAPPPSTWCIGLGYANPGGDPTQQPTFSLLDPADPSYGFNISYAAASSNSICAPSFHLILRCGNNAFPAPNLPAPSGQPAASLSTLIAEVGNCKYEAYSWSLAGCPLECPAPKGNLCSGLGICGFDQAIGASRCFCDDGYISADCSKPASPIPGGAIAGAFFGGLILAACSLLGYGFYLFRAKQGAVGAAGAEGFYATVG